VYRRDEIDVTHFPVFHQMEGVRVFDAQELALLSRDLNADHVQAVGADLKTALSGLARRLFGDHVEMRWVDAYFPFTEPSWELEVLMEGKWLEVLGCGVIQRAIIDNCFANTDASSRPSSQVHGWAFGLGLERLAMRLFDIPDIRLFWSQGTVLNIALAHCDSSSFDCRPAFHRTVQSRIHQQVQAVQQTPCLLQRHLVLAQHARLPLEQFLRIGARDCGRFSGGRPARGSVHAPQDTATLTLLPH
jgi:hypothetical protein